MTNREKIAEAANDCGARGVHARLLQTRVTFLEMDKPLKRSFPLPLTPRIMLLKAENICSPFFRFLFEQVGKPHFWPHLSKAPHMLKDDIELDNFINSDNTELHVLYCDGCPAGFFMLDLSGLHQQVELSLFGLIPDYQGLALGKWFLASAINAAWHHEPEKLVVETNSLDHPAALPLYQKLGFFPVGYKDETIETWG